MQTRLLRLIALYVTCPIAGVTICLSTVAAPASAASSITVSGTVHCHGGAVNGVWVASSGGGSEFASKHYLPNDYADMQYSATVVSGNIQLRVGCGGNTPTANWGSTNNSPWRVLSGSRTLNAFCSGSGSCSWPTTGKKWSNNLGDAGNCTWEALDKWHSYEGYYPLWSGNAYEWSTTAAQNGWSVTTVPMSESIVVYPAAANNGYDGHVAWVNSVTVSGNSVQLNITEMNVNGLGVVDTRTVTANSSLRYIVAPN